MLSRKRWFDSTQKLIRSYKLHYNLCLKSINRECKFKLSSQVSMMSDNGVATNDVSSGGGVPHIKKEMEVTFSECSPSNSDMYSPTTTVMHDQGVSISSKTFLKRTFQRVLFYCNASLLIDWLRWRYQSLRQETIPRQSRYSVLFFYHTTSHRLRDRTSWGKLKFV